MVSLLRVSVLVIFLSALCLAQSTGGIQGTVTDATGAVLSNAEIDATNTATGQHQTVRRYEAVLYAIPSLPTGTYSLQVKAPGMQTTIASNVTVAVSTVTRQD